MNKQIKIISLILLISFSGFAQEYDENGKEIVTGNKKGFNIGLYLGSYWANNYTASIYNGYGYDVDGIRNTYENSLMYNKIIVQYGGGYPGGHDYIADALGVNQGDWKFIEDYMPTNMRYSPAFMVALQMRYSVDNKNVILFNINATQLNITGNFTIYAKPASGSTQINNAYRTCAIKGVEQRLMFQLGYQHVFISEKNINPFLEAGMNITMAKMNKNQILIGDLLIDLTDYYYQPGVNNASLVKKQVGIGLGAFAGAGLNLNMAENFRLQILYNPSYEGIKLGTNTGLRFQHSVGLRVYYGF